MKVINDRKETTEAMLAFVKNQESFAKGGEVSIDGREVTGYLTIAFSVDQEKENAVATVVGMNVGDDELFLALKAIASKLKIQVVEIPLAPLDKKELN